jgi:MFS family permease
LSQFIPQHTPHLRLGWKWPQALRALKHRNFRLFFLGQFISLIGSWMQATALQWLVYRITGSQLSLGTVTFVSFIPVLFLSLFMGVLIDRLPRRRILLFTQSWFLIQAAAIAFLTYTGLITYEIILILALLLGIANALDMPTRQSFYVEMVERDDLFNAIALNSSIINGARIIGPAVAGIIIAQLGEAPAFAINSVSYLAVIGGLLMMRLPPKTSGDHKKSGGQDLLEGFRYLLHDRRILGLVGMVAAFSVFGFPFRILLPVIAQDVLAIGAKGYGVLMAVQGAGALSGALSLAWRGDRRHKGRMLFLSRILIAIAMLMLALSRNVYLTSLALFLAGFAMINLLATTNTAIQLIVPDKLRGRVLSSYTWALGGFFPIGSLMIGLMGDRLGAPSAILISSFACFILAGAGQGLFPEMRRLK